MNTRRLLIALPLVLAAIGGRAFAQEITLAEVSSYFNALRTGEGSFTQVNADGSVSTGTIYIKRPGRIRFEYDPPEQALVIAGGGSLAIFDPRSNTSPERYPLSQTPLSLILSRNVDLENAEMVTAFASDAELAELTAQDPDHPEYGSIRMIFTANPIALRQWVITDNTGSETTIYLDDMIEGERISDVLFNIIAETRKWNE